MAQTVPDGDLSDLLTGERLGMVVGGARGVNRRCTTRHPSLSRMIRSLKDAEQ